MLINWANDKQASHKLITYDKKSIACSDKHDICVSMVINKVVLDAFFFHSNSMHHY